MLGIEVLLEVLSAAGVDHIFGNPGSTELPLNDALVRDSRFNYIFGLHELPLTAMADGFAIASGGLGVVCVHTCCGLGNAMGMLYNAHCAGSPLMILAGQQDRRLRFGDPVLTGEMVEVVRPWTKWAVEVQRLEDLPAAVRRAVQAALTPPTGPVFMSLPVDIQLETAPELDLRPPRLPNRRIRPPADALRQAAEMLAQAQNPAILAGSRVVEAGAVNELVALAEVLGAPVMSEQQTSHGRPPVPLDHPLYMSILPLWSPDIRQCLEGHDVIFAVGMNLLRLYIYHEPENPFPEESRLIHLDADPWELGKNYPLDLALLGDPRAGLAELSQVVTEILPAEGIEAAAARRQVYASQRTAEKERLLSQIDSSWEARPMSPMALMGALALALPPEAAVVEEAATTHYNLLERLGVLNDPAARIAHRGWALGWGVGCAVGVKLAWPEKPVVALLGDGASLYGIQGLWTAAHHRIPVTFVIANNTQYKILKVSGRVMQLPEVVRGNHLGMDLVEPEVDFVALAHSFGVRAHRVTEPDELSQRVRDSLNQTEPTLLDVRIER
jgi:benzoylformate decarboxylase